MERIALATPQALFAYAGGGAPTCVFYTPDPGRVAAGYHRTRSLCF